MSVEIICRLKPSRRMRCWLNATRSIRLPRVHVSGKVKAKVPSICGMLQPATTTLPARESRNYCLEDIFCLIKLPLAQLYKLITRALLTDSEYTYWFCSTTRTISHGAPVRAEGVHLKNECGFTPSSSFISCHFHAPPRHLVISRLLTTFKAP